MGGMIDAQEQKILDHFTGKTTFTAPTWYVGLSTTVPTETGGTFVEPLNGGYTRPALTAATWTAATGGNPSSTSYGAVIQFQTATGGWGTVSYFGLFSVATQSTGIVQFWGTLTTAKAIQTNDTPSFAANTLLVKLGDPPDTF